MSCFLLLEILEMTNEQILLPMALDSEGHGFRPEIDTYRSIVEEAVFQCIGRPVFFDEAVEMVLGGVTAHLKRDLRTATSPEAIRGPIKTETKRLRDEIEDRFAVTGILGVPAAI
jgi:hypothetical protein